MKTTCIYILVGCLFGFFFNQSYPQSHLTQHFFFTFQIKYFFGGGCLAITAAWFYFSISFPDSDHSIFMTALVYCSLHQLQRQLSMYWTGLILSLVFVAFFFSFFSPDRTSRVCDKNRHYLCFNGTTVAITSKSIARLKLLHIHRGHAVATLSHECAPRGLFVFFVVLLIRRCVIIYY